MDYIDHQYIQAISSRLRNFHKLGRSKYNFSCPICGDSTKNKTKARGYLLSKGKDTFYYCHNDTGCNSTLDNFLRRLDVSLHRQYRLDKFKESVKAHREFEDESIIPEKPAPIKPVDTTDQLIKLLDLPLDHPARHYIDSRRIPTSRHTDIFYCSAWRAFTNSVLPEATYSQQQLALDHDRIVFPLRTKDGEIFAYQGRAINKAIIPRYLTIKLDPNAVKIFGQDKVNDKETVYILEGPIDSMFIRNAVALAGSDVSIDSCPYSGNRVFVLDNEPRNSAIVRKYYKLLQQGEKVVSWKNCKWKDKDVNDMVLHNPGCTIEAVNTYLHTHVISGLRGKLEIDQWKKCLT